MMIEQNHAEVDPISHTLIFKFILVSHIFHFPIIYAKMVTRLFKHEG